MSSHRSAWKRVPSLRVTFRPLAVRLVLGALIATFVLWVSRASAGPAPATPRIALLTMGPGDDFVTKFGHNAIVVEYPGQPARVYNFGMYTRESITVSRVLSGHLRYWLAVTPYAETVALYRSQNRSVIAQELALVPASARVLAEALAENARPENASYRYDYALNNCTTRVRDLLNNATNGALSRAVEVGREVTTYRGYALRYAAGDPLLLLLFDLGLGAPADRSLDGWNDTYLPERLAAAVRRGKHAWAGVERPLVERETVLFAASRPPTLERPPSRWPWYLACGVLVGGALFASARSQRREVRVAGAVIAALSSLVVGLLGSMLLGLLLTQVHAVVRPNVNILMCSPLALLFVPATVRVALGRTLRTRRVERWALASSVIAIFGAASTSLIGEQTAHLALCFVPFWFGLWEFLRAATLPAAAPSTIRKV